MAQKNKMEVERLVMAYSRRLNEIIDSSIKQIKGGRGIPHDEIWSRIERSAAKRSASERRNMA
jgi:hypothetical protein